MDFLYGTSYNYTYIAIGLGMVISLFLTETIGVMAGGIIVPGYFALYLHNPLMIIATFSISLIAYLIVFIISKFMLIYGRTPNDYLKLAKAHKKKVAIGLIIVVAVLSWIF